MYLYFIAPKGLITIMIGSAFFLIVCYYIWFVFNQLAFNLWFLALVQVFLEFLKNLNNTYIFDYRSTFYHNTVRVLRVSKGNTNINSVVEFQRWWVLKSKLFGQESTCHQGKIFKKFLQVMTVCQKVPKWYFQTTI